MCNVEQGAIRRQAVVHDRQNVVKAFVLGLDDARTDGRKEDNKRPEW